MAKVKEEARDMAEKREEAGEGAYLGEDTKERMEG